MTTSPTFAEIPLVCDDGAPCSGAAFELQDPPRESEVVAVDGWEAEVREGQPTVVVRCGSEANYGDALRVGLATGQKALDLMSMRGGNNLVIKAFDDEQVVWWVEEGGVVIRVVSLAPVGLDVPPVTVTVTDPGRQRRAGTLDSSGRVARELSLLQAVSDDSRSL